VYYLREKKCNDDCLFKFRLVFSQSLLSLDLIESFLALKTLEAEKANASLGVCYCSEYRVQFSIDYNSYRVQFSRCTSLCACVSALGEAVHYIVTGAC